MLKDCTSVELIERLHLDLLRLPVEGLIELTNQCNLSCAHCYINQPVRAEDKACELSTERLLQLMREIAEAGGLYLTLSGGEALAREDFHDIYRAALRLGFLVSVFTNGTLISERMADLFDEHRPRQIEITIYGATRGTHERVTGVPGSYDRCMSGIARLHRRGIDVRLKTMALTWNAHELVAMKAYADGLGLPFRFDGQLNPRIDCGASRYRELQLSADAFVSLERQFGERFEEMRSFMRTRREQARQAYGLYECGAGLTGYTIDAAGRLLLCELSRRRFVDLSRTSFGQGWERLGALRQGLLSPGNPCRGCDLRPLCGSCAGANELEHGDPERLVAAFCEITHLRAAELWGDASGHRADASCCFRRSPPKTPIQLEHITPRTASIQ